MASTLKEDKFIEHCKKNKDPKLKAQHRYVWYRLRRHNKYTGLTDVEMSHPLFVILIAIRLGIRNLIMECADLGPKDNLMTSDYSSVIEKRLFLENGKQFLFESFAPTVFATIRRAINVEESSYMESISSLTKPYLEFISNSRSGQEFFLSHDMQFLIKTNKKRDVMFFLSILGDYLQHFVSYPHSLIVKYVGCYSVKLPGKEKKYFLVMKNIFFPADRIEVRYDVKGCRAGRYQEPSPPGSAAISVLKDQNFSQEKIELGSQAEWFISQIKADSTFLRSLNTMDYSLLVGRQRLHKNEQNDRFSDLVMRLKKSVVGTHNSKIACLHGHPVKAKSESALKTSVVTGITIKHKMPATEVSENMIKRSHLINLPSIKTSIMTVPNKQELDNLPGHVDADYSSSAIPQFRKGIKFPNSLSIGLENFLIERRRLLPNCPNALHIIDGPKYRYFFGIVDFLTDWTYKQKAARLWKYIKYGCREHSTVPPRYYSQRFITYITKHVQ